MKDEKKYPMGFSQLDNRFCRKQWAAMLGPHATSVYLTIFSHTIGFVTDKEFTPDYALLARETGLNRRTVMNAVALLEHFQLIQVNRLRGYKAKNIYTILPLPDDGPPMAETVQRFMQARQSKRKNAVEGRSVVQSHCTSVWCSQTTPHRVQSDDTPCSAVPLHPKEERSGRDSFGIGFFL